MTPRRLRDLRREAAEAGDLEQVRLCERALDGDPIALDACRRAVARAEAMADRPVVVTVAGEADFAACHPLASLALSRVELLGAAAAEAGDAATVLVCARALGGNLDALHECARLIRGAR